MQRCPWCGVRNLDSDTHCFNCDGPLEQQSAPSTTAPATMDLKDILPPPSVTEEARPRRAPRKTPLVALVGVSLFMKLFYLVLSLGFSCIVTLLVIWLAYSNFAAAMMCLSIFLAGALFAYIYPDVSRRAINGRRGGLVAFLSDLVFLGILVPPLLLFLEKRTYIQSAYSVFSRYFWVFVALLLLGFLVGYISGNMAERRKKEKAPLSPVAPRKTGVLSLEYKGKHSK